MSKYSITLIHYIIKDCQKNCNRKVFEKQTVPAFLRGPSFFLRGEIESGFSSIQDLLYVEIMFKVCRISERNGKFLKEL